MLKFKDFLAIIFTGFSTVFFAQLSGVATLSNSSNHLGIKVKFISNSQTSVTDSVYTDASGNYSINIAPGVYYVRITKPGYQTVNYNNNVSLLLSNSTTLNPTTLIPGTAIVNVNGNVSGSWTSNNIYNVTGDLHIPYNQTLTIEPGTTVQVAGHYSILAWGVLTANGGDFDPIVFTSANLNPSPGDWAGINLYDVGSSITGCILEYGTRMIMGGVTIVGNDIRKFSYIGIMSSAYIKSNKVHDFLSASTSSAGILAGYAGTVECNEVYNGIGYGIKITGGYTPVVLNNVVHDMIDPNNSLGFGITIEGGGDALISDNVVYNCRSGIAAGGYYSTDAKSKVVNNTIYSNTVGVTLGLNSGTCITVDIINNLVVNNLYGIEQGSYPLLSSQITHNDVWNNSTANYHNVNVVAIGQTVSTNSNGDPVDSYLNISKDPLFVNNTPPYLSATSPCMNVGNSNYSEDIGCHANQICTTITSATPTPNGIHEMENERIIIAYPNPFSNEIYLQTNGEKVTVKLLDILGKQQELEIMQIEGKLKVNTEQVNSGIYFLEIISGNSKETIKLIKN